MRAQWGQNFLHDENWQKKIVSYFQSPGEFGEIGPGQAALTKHLETQGKKFWVFEIDPRLWPLHETSSQYELVRGDFLDWNFKLGGESVHNFSLIGNLPYESGTAMVNRIVENADKIVHFVFLLQKEVVERLTAKDHTRDFGSLTVHVQGQFRLEALDRIPPGAFRPKPEVESQIVRGTRREHGAHPLSLKYSKFVRSAFLQKRKTLRNVLKSRYPVERLDKVFDAMNFKPSVRAEEVAVDLWPVLYQHLELA